MLARLRRSLASVLAGLLLASHVSLSGLGADDADAALEERLRAFTQHVRCLVCQNESLAESRADLAVDLRREIREQMQAGRSDEQITAYLTERYGDFVLYRPPIRPSTYPLWFGPFVLLAGGLLALYRRVRPPPGSNANSSTESVTPPGLRGTIPPGTHLT